MSNARYCRFRNTLSDLSDCAEALFWGNDADLDDDEARAKRRLIELCTEIAREHGNLDDE
jgi:hypothetical protein